MPSKKKPAVTTSSTAEAQPFTFSYLKPDIKTLIADIADEPLSLLDGQLYSPINEVLLKLNPSNAYSATFNYDVIAESIQGVDFDGDDDDGSDGGAGDTHSHGTCSTNGGSSQVGGFVTLLCHNNGTNKQEERRSFIKFSPLLDPIRYLVGKYDVADPALKELPLHDSTNSHPKSRDHDNASYVDSLFSFLSSKLLNHHGFINALDCYGSVIGTKRRYTINAIDDIDYLLENDFFIKNNNVLYETSNSFYNQVANHGSRSRKLAIKIHDDDDDINGNADEHRCTDICDDVEIVSEELVTTDSPTVLTLVDISDLKELESFGDDTVPSKRQRSSQSSDKSSAKTARTGSTSCSSRTSNTSGDDEQQQSSRRSATSERSCTTAGNSSSSSTASEDSALISICDFPVNAIFLEECEETLDYLCAEDEEFGSEELCAALMQVIMSLIAFHKCFDFQHNDLHTNNVMYVPTKKQFLYYRVNGSHYKVPTYGRIFKIIDFGRATYKFRGNQFCSDSFHKDGDAHSQFNFGRCYDPDRPVIAPNNSFDLCRLGTSLIDFLIEDLDDIKTTKDPTIAMVAEWCTDDRGRNVLWKANGDERYPGFKLYKMISRTVSKHTPVSQLERPILDRYKCPRKNIKKGTTIMNIDALPVYTETESKVTA